MLTIAKYGCANILVALVLWGFDFSTALQAGSGIYKHVDKDGRITFTNRPIKGGQQIKATPRSSRLQADSPAATDYFPKENMKLQKKRDIKRREILEHELALEMQLFSEARKNLSLMRHDHENPQQEKKRHLQTKLMRHENNIAALKKELDKL